MDHDYCKKVMIVLYYLKEYFQQGGKNMRKKFIKVTAVMLAVFLLIPSISITASAKTKKVLYSKSKTSFTLKAGKSKSLKITYKQNGNVYWKSSKKGIVSCTWSDFKGDNTSLKVKALKAGSTVLTVSADTTKQKIKFKIKVTGSSNDVEYISDREVQYSDDDKEQWVFFGLMNDSEERVAASGTASISITNEDGENVFDKDISFSKDDFSTWTSTLEGNRYLCCIKIPDSDITPGKSDEGSLTIGVTLDDGSEFASKKLSVDNLPVKKASSYVTIELPSDITKTRYDDSYRASAYTLSSLTYDVEASYDGTYKATVHFKGKKTYNSRGNNMSGSLSIPWKLYDSDGVVVDSGTAFTPDVAVGDAFSEDEVIYDLKSGTYKLVIADVSI